MRTNKNPRDYYKLLRMFSTGSFQSIYEAKNKETNEKRAIILINKNQLKDLISDDIDDIDFFHGQVNIIKIMSGKNNENINTIKFYEYFDTEDEFAIVTDLCDCDLVSFLKDKGNHLKVGEIYNILFQLNNSFKIMRENKIIHRDIKPENILVKYNNSEKTNYTIKLSGYEVSHQIKKEHSELSNVGTCFYMAPEVKLNNYDEKCDLWSLGILIYMLYFNSFPFGNVMIKNIDYNQNKLKKTGNEDLDDLIRRLLTEDPKKRITWDEYFKHSFFDKKNENSLQYFKEDRKQEIVKREEFEEFKLIQQKEIESLKKKVSILEETVENLKKQLQEK